MSAREELYFEDLVSGESAETPGMTLTEAHVAQYLGLTGDWREETGPARRVPDMLPLALSSGLGWRFPKPPLAILAFMGIEWRFLLTLHVGDTIRSRSTTVTKRSLRDSGVLIESRQILNQRDEVAQTGRITLLVARRPQETAGGVPPASAGRG